MVVIIYVNINNTEKLKEQESQDTRDAIDIWAMHEQSKIDEEED